MNVLMIELGTHLSGRPKGIKDFAKICETLAPVRAGELVVLDFREVEYVSASWISAMLLPLARRGAEPDNDFFLIIASFPKDSVDDLQLVAEQARLPFLLVSSVSAKRAKLIGVLDSGQRQTLEVVQELGEVTGAELAEKCPEYETKGPAWNNRLRDLFDKRLLRRRKEGREQIYSPIVPEVLIHG